MHISFDTNTDTADAAHGLVRALLAIYPSVAEQFASVATKLNAHIVASGAVESIAKAARAVAQDVTVPHVVGASIDPEDNPSAGAATASEVFTMGASPAPVLTEAANGIPYEQYIASGWTDKQLIAAGMLARPGFVEAVFTAPPAPPAPPAQVDAAAVFGGANGPLAPSNGASPAPSNNAAIPPPPPNDAASVFGATNVTPAQVPDDARDDAPTMPPAHLDTNGLPWDARIHAATRTANKDGSWKKKKGADEALVAQVVDELRAVVAADKAAHHVPLNAVVPPPPPPGVQLAPPPPPPAAHGQVVTFADVAKFVGERNFSAEIVQQVCQKHGIPGLALLTGAPNLCAPILADLQAVA